MADSITFRFAQREDTSLILGFIKGLAAHEGIPNAVQATEAALEKQLFNQDAARVVFLCENGKEVGFALYFFGFSSYPCKPYLFINDLFIKEEHRGKGYGKLLIAELERIAKERDCCRIELLCFEGNTSGKDFYARADVDLKSDLLVYRKNV